MIIGKRDGRIMVNDLLMMVIECTTVDQRTNISMVLDSSLIAQLP